MGLKNEVVAPLCRFPEHNFWANVLAKSHIGADSRKSAPLLLLARTFAQKLCSGNGIKVQLPHFLSPTEALEGTLCLVMNLLCIVYLFDIQV